MSTQDIIQVIRQKFDQKARASTDLYRQAYNLFGRPEHGVTKDHFRRTMHRMGVPVSRNDVNKLFDMWDENGNGILEFCEFSRQVMAKDYPTAPWYAIRGAQMKPTVNVAKFARSLPQKKLLPNVRVSTPSPMSSRTNSSRDWRRSPPRTAIGRSRRSY